MNSTKQDNCGGSYRTQQHNTCGKQAKKEQLDKGWRSFAETSRAVHTSTHPVTKPNQSSEGNFGNAKGDGSQCSPLEVVQPARAMPGSIMNKAQDQQGR